jgi:predicted  nucleic acid-binding Zn-ribbon protein
LASVAALAKSEEHIMQIGSDLVTLVEETDFGIALPAALRVVIEEMDDVKQSLTAGSASEDVVAAERQIEADLKALLDAMKQMPAQASGKQQKGSPQDRQRELNRIIAELKMIRILQTRVTADTKHVDEKRSEVEQLSGALRQKIQNIHDRQQDVRDVTEKLTSERGNEVR